MALAKILCFLSDTTAIKLIIRGMQQIIHGICKQSAVRMSWKVRVKALARTTSPSLKDGFDAFRELQR